MKYTKQEFLDAIYKLEQINPRGSFWIREDYKSCEIFLAQGIISIDNAEYEFDRLTEETIEELEKNGH